MFSLSQCIFISLYIMNTFLKLLCNLFSVILGWVQHPPPSFIDGAECKYWEGRNEENRFSSLKVISCCVMWNIFFLLTPLIENKIVKHLGCLLENHSATMELPFEISFANATVLHFKAKGLISCVLINSSLSLHPLSFSIASGILISFWRNGSHQTLRLQVHFPPVVSGFPTACVSFSFIFTPFWCNRMRCPLHICCRAVILCFYCDQLLISFRVSGVSEE